MLLKRVSVSNKSEHIKLDSYLKLLNIDKKNKWKNIKSNESNFEKRFKKFQNDVSKVKSNLTESEIKSLSPSYSSNALKRSALNQRKSAAAASNISKFTYKLEQGIDEVARTNRVLYTYENNSSQNSDHTAHNEYCDYYFKRLNTFDSIQSTNESNHSVNSKLSKTKPIVNTKDDHVSVSLPSISSLKSNFQKQNLDSFYATQTDDFEESNYFQHLIHKRYLYEFKAKQLNRNKFSCH